MDCDDSAVETREPVAVEAEGGYEMVTWSQSPPDPMLSDPLTKICKLRGAPPPERKLRPARRILSCAPLAGAAVVAFGIQSCALDLIAPADTGPVGSDSGDVDSPRPSATPIAPPTPTCPAGEELCGEACIGIGEACDCTSDAECITDLANVAQAECINHECEIVACSASAYDCDGSSSNGCEILLSDPAPPAAEPLLAATPTPTSAAAWQTSGQAYPLLLGCPDCSLPLGLPEFPAGIKGVGAEGLAEGDLDTSVRIAWNAGGVHLYFFHVDDDLNTPSNATGEDAERENADAAWNWDNFEVVWDADPSQGNGADNRFLFVSLDGSFVEYKGDNPKSNPNNLVTDVNSMNRCTFMEVTLDAQFLSGRDGPTQGLALEAGNRHGLAVAVNDFDHATVDGEDIIVRQHQLFLQVPPSPMGGYWFERPNLNFPEVQLEAVQPETASE